MKILTSAIILILALTAVRLMASQQTESRLLQADHSKASVIQPQSDPAVDPRHKFIARTIHVLDQAHQIFAESYKLLIDNSGVAPSSALKVVKSRLNHGPKLVCPTNHDEIQISENIIRIVAVNCHLNSREEVAIITWSADLRQMQFEVWPNQVPDGVGSALAMLNRKITCGFLVNIDSDRIETLQCSALGYGVDTSTHVEFKKFQFGLKHNDLLVIEADRYKNLFERVVCGMTQESCLKMTVPLNGRIHITNNRKKDPSQQALLPPPNAVIFNPQKLVTGTEDFKNGEKSGEEHSEKSNEENIEKNKPGFAEAQAQELQGDSRVGVVEPANAALAAEGDEQPELQSEQLSK